MRKNAMLDKSERNDDYNLDSLDMAGGFGNRRILFAEIYHAGGFGVMLDTTNLCRWVVPPDVYVDLQSGIQVAIADAIEETIDDLYPGHAWEYDPDRMQLENDEEPKERKLKDYL